MLATTFDINFKSMNISYGNGNWSAKSSSYVHITAFSEIYIYIYICIYIYNFLSAGKRLFKVIDESTIVNTSAKLISILLKLNGISWIICSKLFLIFVKVVFSPSKKDYFYLLQWNSFKKDEKNRLD